MMVKEKENFRQKRAQKFWDKFLSNYEKSKFN